MIYEVKHSDEVINWQWGVLYLAAQILWTVVPTGHGTISLYVSIQTIETVSIIRLWTKQNICGKINENVLGIGD